MSDPKTRASIAALVRNLGEVLSAHSVATDDEIMADGFVALGLVAGELARERVPSALWGDAAELLQQGLANGLLPKVGGGGCAPRAGDDAGYGVVLDWEAVVYHGFVCGLSIRLLPASGGESQRVHLGLTVPQMAKLARELIDVARTIKTPTAGTKPN